MMIRQVLQRFVAMMIQKVLQRFVDGVDGLSPARAWFDRAEREAGAPRAAGGGAAGGGEPGAAGGGAAGGREVGPSRGREAGASVEATRAICQIGLRLRR
jgi:hypothetical protein